MHYFGETLRWSAADALGGTVGGYEFGMCLLESLQLLEQLIVITVRNLWGVLNLVKVFVTSNLVP
jgi:hypothetical protein